LPSGSTRSSGREARAVTPTAAGGHWLILARPWLAASPSTRARGARAILATPGAAYRCLGEDRYERWTPARREDFEALVRDVTAGEGSGAGRTCAPELRGHLCLRGGGGGRT
jgi:hypothetical protein